MSFLVALACETGAPEPLASLLPFLSSLWTSEVLRSDSFLDDAPSREPLWLPRPAMWPGSLLLQVRSLEVVWPFRSLELFRPFQESLREWSLECRSRVLSLSISLPFRLVCLLGLEAPECVHLPASLEPLAAPPAPSMPGFGFPRLANSSTLA